MFHSQSSKGENHHQRDLLSLGHCHIFDDSHWYRDHCNIGRDANGGTEVPPRGKIDTLRALHTSIPRSLDRVARKDIDQSRDNPKSQGDDQQCIAKDSRPPEKNETQALTQSGTLDRSNTHTVAENTRPQGLFRVLSVAALSISRMPQPSTSGAHRPVEHFRCSDQDQIAFLRLVSQKEEMGMIRMDYLRRKINHTNRTDDNNANTAKASSVPKLRTSTKRQ